MLFWACPLDTSIPTVKYTRTGRSPCDEAVTFIDG